MRRNLRFLMFFAVFVCVSGAPALGAELGYRVVDVSGRAEVYQPVTGESKAIKKGDVMLLGTLVRTGQDGSVDLAADAYYENVLHIGPDTQVNFLSFLPIRVSLDEGSLFVLKEEHNFVNQDPALSPEVRVLTRSFLAGLRQGGFALEARGSRVVMKVFSEEVAIQTKAGGSYSQVPFLVEEGFRYSSEGWERLLFPDYKVWQSWYKGNNKRKDRLGGSP